jgi:hypothetical protein
VSYSDILRCVSVGPNEPNKRKFHGQVFGKPNKAKSGPNRKVLFYKDLRVVLLGIKHLVREE